MLRKFKYRKKKYMLLIFAIVSAIGIGFAVISSTVDITGLTSISPNNWNVHFENIKDINVISHGVKDENPVGPAIDEDDSTKMVFNAILAEPDDEYSFTVDIVNGGTVNAMLENVVVSDDEDKELSEDILKYLTYTVTYEDGSKMIVNDGIKKKEFTTVKVSVKYKDITNDDIPEEELNTNFKITIQYRQADKTKVKYDHSKKNPICIVASSLHADGDGYFGSLYDDELVPGTALSCDVNGNGEYDELFYYVSKYYDTDELEFNDDYAVLMYSGSTDSTGNMNSTVLGKYGIDRDSNDFMGPIEGVNNLPTTAMWSNIKLLKTSRSIVNERGTKADKNSKAITNKFDYSGHAARFITLQELESTGLINEITDYTDDIDLVMPGANFLLENTYYETKNEEWGYYLETPCYDGDNNVFLINGYTRQLSNHGADNELYVTKPVIDVKLSDIKLN